MTESDVLYLAKEAIGTGLLVGGPILGVSLLVGLIISVFQAMTQIQEQTLTFIPKIFAIALVLILLGPWLLEIMTNYTINLFTELPNFAKY
ncbi:MAG: flagellar biosynthesis protein FliQ [Bacillota bacterium]|jgi:flagellar biosynthetic protein FliQ|nr:flagellar biosynthesis protein FliQ [Clostridia bacterium]